MGLWTDQTLATRDRWDQKLRGRGHVLQWNQVSPWPSRRWLGVCARCGGELECGHGRSASAGKDIRTGICTLSLPQAQPWPWRRPQLRLLRGGLYGRPSTPGQRRPLRQVKR